MDQRQTSDGPATDQRRAMDEETDEETGGDGRAATDEQRRASRQTSDGPVMDKQTEQRADE